MNALPATTTIDAAAVIRWDVVVIGAGPAGGASALRLARHGLQVLLIDRGPLPRGKLCGCCLAPAAITELRRLAIGPGGPLARAVPLHRIHVATGGHQAAIDVQGGATLSRETLDATLAAAAVAAGGQWLPETAALAIDEHDADEPLVRVTVREACAADGRTTRLECRRLLLATGLAASVRLPGGAAFDLPAAVAPRSRIGIGAVLPATAAPLPPGELLMAVADCGYCGIVRLEDGRIDVAAAVDRQALAAIGPIATLRRIVGEACGPAGGWATLGDLDTVAIRATPALTRSAPLVVGAARSVWRVGDAAGYVEPFTGEGMGWALVAARLAADALCAAGRGELEPASVAAGRYATAHAGYFPLRHARCRRVAAVVRRPRIMDLAVRAAQLAPWAARLAVPVVTGGHAGGRSAVGGAA
jgi:flavin-dependent dehydrogenase